MQPCAVNRTRVIFWDWFQISWCVCIACGCSGTQFWLQTHGWHCGAKDMRETNIKGWSELLCQEQTHWGLKKREQRRERPFKTGEQTRELLAIPKGNIKAANIIQKEAFAEWDHCWNTDSEYKGSVSVFEWKLCLKIYYLRLALSANWQVYLWILFPLLFLSLSLPPWTCDLWKLAD